jgi:hypothetical protein
VLGILSMDGTDVDGVAGRDPPTGGPPATCRRKGLTDEMTHRCSARVLQDVIHHTAIRKRRYLENANVSLDTLAMPADTSYYLLQVVPTYKHLCTWW